MDFKDLRPRMILATHNERYYFLYFIKRKYPESVVVEEHLLPNRRDLPYLVTTERVNRTTWEYDRLGYLNTIIASDIYFKGFIKGIFESPKIEMKV
jgi:hypothetical protein